MICQIVADLFAGFLVLYTYLATDSSIVNGTENNLAYRDNELINNEPLKKINGRTLLLIVSFIEFIIGSSNTIYILYFDRLKEGEIVWLISVSTVSRIFFFPLFTQNKLI